MHLKTSKKEVTIDIRYEAPWSLIHDVYVKCKVVVVGRLHVLHDFMHTNAV